MLAALRAIAAGIAESILDYLRNAATKHPVDSAPSNPGMLRRIGSRVRRWMRADGPSK
jgi:hypothetical protein